MKQTKRLFSILLTMMLLTGCSIMDLFGGGISAPTNVKILDDEISWTAVDSADGYTVFVDEEVYANTTKNRYQFDDFIDEDLPVTIKAYKTNGNEKKYSSASTEVTRYKNQFASQETLIYDYISVSEAVTTYSANVSVTVTPSIRYVSLMGVANVVYTNFDIKISERKYPLLIEFNNFTFSSNQGKIALLQQKNSTDNPLITILSKGLYNSIFTNESFELAGANGSNGAFLMPGGNGGKGKEGNPGGSLGNVLVKGDADFTIKGGKGGRGGNGGNGNANAGGNGGNGGKGGVGLVFDILYLKLDEFQTLKLLGGDGGDGGSPGSGLNPMVTPKSGNDGEQGGNYKGTLSEISGILSLTN